MAELQALGEKMLNGNGVAHIDGIAAAGEYHQTKRVDHRLILKRH